MPNHANGARRRDDPELGGGPTAGLCLRGAGGPLGAGLVGGLQAAKLAVIEPMGAFSLQWTIDVVNIAIIGGQGTIVGPLLGAAFIVGLGEALAVYPELHVAISGLILVAVIRFAPRGIWGSLIAPLLPRVPGIRRLVT